MTLKQFSTALVAFVALLFSGVALSTAPAASQDYSSYASSSQPPGTVAVYSCPAGYTFSLVDGVAVCFRTVSAIATVPVIATVPATVYTCPAGYTGTPVAGGTCVNPNDPTDIVDVDTTVPATVYSCPVGTSGTPVAGGTCNLAQTAQETIAATLTYEAIAYDAVEDSTGTTGTTGAVVTAGTTTTTTSTIATGVITAAVDYGFTAQTVTAQPALAVTGSSTSLLGFIATSLIALGAITIAGRRKFQD